jgi:ABC-type Fe3+/spermidine/putrescine transport system ATPase subunit
VAVGKPAVLLVRPESLRLSTQPHSGDTLPATVLRTSYLGSLAEYEIELHGQKLIAVRHDPGEADLYAAGTAVSVQLLRDNVYCLNLDS